VPTTRDARLAEVDVTAGLLAGDRFAQRYRIVRPLGEGGMGAVYLATDELLGEDVALKIALGIATDDGERVIERQRREVSLARRVTHPNVARVFDLGVDGGLLYITMEHVPGTSLRTRLRRGPLVVDDAVTIAHQVASALAAAHDAGVVHLDLKPDNVIVVDGAVPRAVLVDFGVSRALGERATGAGTLDYMAPEQLGEEAIGGAADVYALGLLLSEALTGERPFGKGQEGVLARLTRRPPLLAPPVPSELAGLVDACLARQPGDRPSARVVERVLGKSLARGAVAVEDRPNPRRGAVVDVASLPAGLGLELAVARSSLAVVGREPEVLAIADEVLASTPDLDVAIALRALARVRTGSNTMAHDDVADRAVVAVSDAVARAPHLADTHVADALIADGGGDIAYAVRALRRALARDPLHAWSHEILGRLELEGGVASEQRLRVAWAIDPAHRACAVHIARELLFQGRDDEALALLDDADVGGVLWEARLMRVRRCFWRRDRPLARALLATLPHEQRPMLEGMRLLLRYIDEDAHLDDLRAVFESLLQLPTSPKRRSFLHQMFIEVLAAHDPEAALSHLLGAVQLPLADLRWFDACPVLAPLRASPAFQIARATVQLRLDEAFGAPSAPLAATDDDDDHTTVLDSRPH
jgi:serine/threonine-protein kinase